MLSDKKNKRRTSNGGNCKSGKVKRKGIIENGYQKFLILEAPTDDNIKTYIEILKKKNVGIVVRACEPTYDPTPIIEAGIRFREMPFPDGEPPPLPVIDDWLLLLSDEFGKNKDSSVGVHCVAGLGRAPILVAIALVESGKEGFEAVDIIRKVRKGAFNARQLAWIRKYKRKSKFCSPFLSPKTCLIA